MPYFCYVLLACFRDHTATKRNLKAWLFIAVASLIWPVTLPFIISSKLRAKKTQAQPETSFSPSMGTSVTVDS